MSDVLAPLTRRVHTAYCWRVKPGEHPTRIDAALDDTRIGRHLQGPDRYGVTPIAPGESTTRCAVLDLDSHKGEVPWSQMKAIAADIANALRMQELHPIPFKSSGGQGIHLYLLWNEAQDAYSVREALRVALAQCNLVSGTKGVAASRWRKKSRFSW